MPGNKEDNKTVLVKKPDGTFARVSLSSVLNQKKAEPKEKKPVSIEKPDIDENFKKASVEISAQGGSASGGKPEEKEVDKNFKKVAQEISKDNKEKEKPEVEFNLPKMKLTPEIRKKLAIKLEEQMKMPDRRFEREDEDLKLVDEDFSSLLEETLDEKDLEVAHHKNQLPAKSLNDLPVVYKDPELPAKATPFNSFVHNKKIDPASKLRPEIKKSLATPLILRSKSKVEERVKDISSSVKEYGPVEEIKNFTLTDFRRLGDNPEQAASRLKQKFVNLREESYLFFIKGISAWRQSPLYEDYMGVLSQSLTKGKKLSEEIVNFDIKIPEMQALTKMQKELRDL